MAACPHGAPDAATQQWFLRDRRLAVDAAVEKLTAYMKWRADFLPPGGLTREHVAAEADSGKACLHAHPDVNGRPVIIVRVSQHVTGAAPGGPGQAPLQGGAARGRGARGRGARAERGARRAGEFPLDSSKRYCAYLLEQAIAQLPPDGETILGIFDLRGFKTRNADFGFVRFLVRGLAPGAWCLGSGVLPSSVPFLLRATALQRCAARSVVINIWCPHMKRNLPSI